MKNTNRFSLFILLCLIATSLEAVADEGMSFVDENVIQVRVVGPSNSGIDNYTRTFEWSPVQNGNSLAQVLGLLNDGASVWVYAKSETHVIKSDIVVTANNINLVMQNVTIKAPEKAFNHIIKFEGSNSTIFGVKVEGPDDRNLPNGSINTTSGIHVTGDNCELIGCEASRTPNFPASTANNHCFHIQGASTKVRSCKATNPGAICFKSGNGSSGSVYDRIEAIMESPTENSHSRFFTSFLDGEIEIKNSIFRASYPSDTPADHREAAMVFDTVASGTVNVTMSDCDINCGENVGENGVPVIKLSIGVKEANFTRVAIASEDEDYNGHSLSLASVRGLVF